MREMLQPRPKAREYPWVAAFLRALAREDLAAVTVRGYRSDLGLFATWYDGHSLEKLTATDLAHFRQYLSRERALKPASVNRKLEALRRFCRWAHISGKLRTNIAAELKLARTVRSTRPKGLLAAEVQALLRARYSGLRRYLPAFLELPFRAERGTERLLAAIEVARELNRDHARNLPSDAPDDFVPSGWRHR